jgi:glycosyltransferase involved in cell wall biosynthesis
MCPSHTVVHFCRTRFPGMKLGYTPFCVDEERFSFRGEKALQIVTVPRKRPLEFGAILDLFRATHPQFRQLPWVYLHQATEAMVADAMAQSAVFLSLARLEAHGMTALEAMASGCIVAGFAGLHGGTDSATARNGFWADEDDVPGCVQQLARAVQLAADRGMAYDAMLAEGRRTAREYTREASMALLKTFWDGALQEFAGG